MPFCSKATAKGKVNLPFVPGNMMFISWLIFEYFIQGFAYLFLYFLFSLYMASYRRIFGEHKLCDIKWRRSTRDKLFVTFFQLCSVWLYDCILACMFMVVLVMIMLSANAASLSLESHRLGLLGNRFLFQVSVAWYFPNYLNSLHPEIAYL